jgi:hypothetical protein
VWPEASEVCAQFERDLGHEYVTPLPETSELDFTHLTPGAASQIHGGIRRSGEVAPYASLILPVKHGTRLLIAGNHLPATQIGGSTITVFLDEEAVGSIPIVSGAPFNCELRIPDALTNRTYLSVRFRSDDYVCLGPSLRRCVAFLLKRVAIVP